MHEDGLRRLGATVKLAYSQKLVAKALVSCLFPVPSPAQDWASKLTSIPRSAMSSIIAKIETEQLKSDLPDFRVGDSVKVHTRVIEGDKERIQIYAGIVISQKGSGLNKAFTVRKISYGEGVERVFPMHTPRIAKVEVTKRGNVRRNRLHYLRDRQGKEAMSVKEMAYTAPA